MRFPKLFIFALFLMTVSHLPWLFAQDHSSTKQPLPEVRPKPVYFTSQMLQKIDKDLRHLDSAKNQWAIELNKGMEDQPTWQDIEPYLKKFMKMEIPTPPCGGSYVLNNVGASPQFRISYDELKEYKLEAWKAEKERLLQNKANSLDPPSSAQ